MSHHPSGAEEQRAKEVLHDNNNKVHLGRKWQDGCLFKKIPEGLLILSSCKKVYVGGKR